MKFFTFSLVVLMVVCGMLMLFSPFLMVLQPCKANADLGGWLFLGGMAGMMVFGCSASALACNTYKY